MEEWRDIKGYEGLYQVSNLGGVRSLKFYKERVLKPYSDKYGYERVNLYKDGKMTSFLVHRLVAKAFLGDWSMFCTDINHKNEIKTDNRVENLEWCDRQYNIDYSQAKAINQYSKFGELIRTWKSTMEACRNGYDSSHISECCLGKRKTHKGYMWKFKEED